MDFPRRTAFFFLALWFLHALATTACFGALEKPRRLDAPVRRIGFHMDALVAGIRAGDPYGAVDQDGLWFAAHRMPVVPWSLAGILSATENRFAVHAAKTLATTAPLWLALFCFSTAPGVSRRLACAAVAFVALSPQIAQQFYALGTEEGWIMGPIALAGVLVADAGRDRRRTLLVPLPALLYLTKSSLLPFAVALALATAISLRGWRAAACVAMLAAAIAGWGLHTRAVGGGFRTGTSFDGWNLYKGNNPLVLSVYPEGSLDLLDDRELIRPGVPCATEWEWDAAWRTQAKRHIVEHPAAAAAAMLAKAWNLFVNPWNPPANRSLVARVGSVVGAAWMVVFRIVFAVLAWRTARVALAARRGGWKAVAAGAPFALLALAALYSAPYLVGFAYERHALPLAMLCPAMALATLSRARD